VISALPILCDGSRIMDSSIGNEDVIILHQRLQKSVKRINSVLTCPSSVAAEEFLCNWDVEDSWKSLPRKLGVLAERLLEQDLLSGRDGDSYFSPRVTFSSAIFSRVASSRSLEKNLTWSFQRLFSLSLEAHDKRWREMNQATDMLTEDDEDEEEKDKGDEGENDYDIDFDSLFSSLRKLGWLPSCYMVHKALRMAMYDVNENKIRKLICSRYETYGMWGAVLEWKKNVLGPWLFQKVLKISTEDDNDNWKLKIDLLVATSFVHVRMEELFTIITEYPDSKPAVEELREALVYSTTPAQMMRLATSLKENLQRRLLHPGANTAQILDVYISAIKVLRAIDAEGNNNNNGQQQLLLETVTEPIKKYLRARSDTVRCIILGYVVKNDSSSIVVLKRKKIVYCFYYLYVQTAPPPPPPLLLIINYIGLPMRKQGETYMKNFEGKMLLFWNLDMKQRMMKFLRIQIGYHPRLHSSKHWLQHLRHTVNPAKQYQYQHQIE